jgi:hypothetical protein
MDYLIPPLHECSRRSSSGMPTAAPFNEYGIKGVGMGAPNPLVEADMWARLLGDRDHGQALDLPGQRLCL